MMSCCRALPILASPLLALPPLTLVGCGCQEHEVGAVTVVPAAECLTIQAGGGHPPDDLDSGPVGMCETLYLFGDNGCAETLTLAREQPDEGEAWEAEAGASFAFEIGYPAERRYTFQGTLGTEPISVSFEVGAQCGLTGDCG